MTNQTTLALTCSKSSLIIMFVGGHGTVAEDYYGVSAKSTMGRIEGSLPVVFLPIFPRAHLSCPSLLNT